MTYFIDQESFSSVYDETHSPIINDLDEMFDDIVMKLAEYDCLNYWNGREVAFTHDGDSVALNGMTETTRALLQAIGERDGRELGALLLRATA